MMEVNLVVVGGANAGQKVPVAGPKFFIGRSEDCQLRPNSDLVSRHHCVILVEGGLVTLRDFGSKNGSFVNSERVRGEQELKAGDQLVVGPLEFEVQVEVKIGGAKKPKVKSVQDAAARTVQSSDSDAADDELDISDWISGDDAANDTQALGAAQAGTVATETPEATPQSEPSKDESEEQKKDKKKRKDTPSKVVGRLDTSKLPKADSSRSAAADTLRQFFHRK